MAIQENSNNKEPEPLKPITIEEADTLERESYEKLIESQKEQYLDVTYTYLRDLWDKVYISLQNPEEIKIADFKKLRRTDAFISQCYDFLVGSVLSADGSFYILKEELDDVDKQMLEFVNRTFLNTEYLQQGLYNIFANMLTYIIAGFSVSEIVVDYSNELGMYYIKKIVTSDPERISFHMDKHGNIINILVSAIGKVGGLMYPLNMGGMATLSPDKAIIITRRFEFGNPYGESMFRPLYKYALIKDFLVKQAGIYLERLATPVRDVTTTNPSDKQEAERVVAHLHQGRSVVSHAKSVEIKNLETSSQLGHIQAYAVLIEYCDRMIAQALGLDYTAIKGTYKGSVKRAEYFTFFENTQRRILENAINKAVKFICQLNFGEREYYPVWKFSAGLRVEPAILVQLMQVGVLKPTEKWIRMAIGAPPASPELQAELEQRYQTSPILNPSSTRQRAQKQTDESFIRDTASGIAVDRETRTGEGSKE